jgi:hypothetical protein
MKKEYDSKLNNLLPPSLNGCLNPANITIICDVSDVGYTRYSRTISFHFVKLEEKAISCEGSLQLFEIIRLHRRYKLSCCNANLIILVSVWQPFSLFIYYLLLPISTAVFSQTFQKLSYSHLFFTSLNIGLSIAHHWLSTS